MTDPTRSEHIEKLVAGLSQAMANVVNPERNRVVTVQPRDQSKPSYTFSYATLDNIIDVIRKPLTDNGLWFTQIMKEDNGTYILDTRLMHDSGQWIACQTPLIWDGNGGNQQFGSALTFMKRYALTSLLGIAAEEDDDANSADGNKVNAAQDRKPASPKLDIIVNAQAPIDHIEPIEMVIMVKDGKTDWLAFGKDLIGAVKGAKSSAEIDQWLALNKSSLDKMESEASKLYANLNTAILKEQGQKQ